MLSISLEIKLAIVTLINFEFPRHAVPIVRGREGKVFRFLLGAAKIAGGVANCKRVGSVSHAVGS